MERIWPLSVGRKYYIQSDSDIFHSYLLFLKSLAMILTLLKKHCPCVIL